MRTQLQDLVLDLHQKMHTTSIFVTHDMDEALKLGDRIGVMSHGQLLQTDTPENIVQHPVNQFIENFFASSVAKNIYETQLAKLVKSGYVLKSSNAANNLKELDDTETLESAFMELAENDEILVMHDQKKVGYLNRQQVMRYLSEVQR